ncbi:MAG: hypothetical protein OEQ39_05715 [Gammaproteobacteria bacterium]|nr:hypothetical protein [Gammaproteobacteria bacterium]
MPNSDHLNKPYLTAGQTQPDVTINDFLDAVDDALAGSVTVDMGADSDLTPTAAQQLSMELVITDTGVLLTAARNVILEGFSRFHIVKNDTAQELTFKTAAGSGVAVPAGGVRQLIFNDAANVNSVSGQGADAFLYELGAFFPNKPQTSEVVLRSIFTRSIDFPSALTGSQGYCETTATAETDFDVQKNAVSVGTIRFAIATNASTFIAASPISFTAGDRLAIIAPATPDTTLSDIYITLKGTRV